MRCAGRGELGGKVTHKVQQEFRQLKFLSTPHSHKPSPTDTRTVAAVGDKCGCRGQMEMPDISQREINLQALWRIKRGNC